MIEKPSPAVVYPKTTRLLCVLSAWFGFGIALAPISSPAQEPVFATVPEARKVLATEDDFAKRTSPFDRAARMKADREVGMGEFLGFAADQALEWDAPEKETIRAAMRSIEAPLKRLSLPLPAQVLVIKTSGREEGHAAYTRGNAIIFPRRFLEGAGPPLAKFLAHELFHVATRGSPALATRLYEAVGFRRCGEVAFPENLAPLKITNPDAPRNDHAIQVKVGGESAWAMPILFSRSRYDAARGGEFFQYLQLEFLLVDRCDGKEAPKPLRDANGPRRVAVNQVAGFFEQVGSNTQYIIHPEELLADNFAQIVVGEPPRSPEVHKRIEAAIAAR